MAAKTKSKQPVYAIYSRFSQDRKEKGESLKISTQEQQKNGQAKAKALGVTVPDEMVFADEDLSGDYLPTVWLETRRKTANKRDGLSALIEAAEAGKIQGVICRAMDRFSRDKKLINRIIETLYDSGVKIVFYDEPLADGETGELQRDIFIAFNDFQRKKYSKNQKLAKAYAKDEGLRMGGKPSIGYKSGTTAHEIDEAKAKIVKQIFKRFMDGESLTGLTKWLNETYPKQTVKGADFSRTSVRKILVNPHYIGKQYNQQGELIDSKVYPAIISEEIYLDASTRIQQNKRTRRGIEVQEYLASGFIQCGFCNSTMIAVRSRNETHYRCPKCSNAKGKAPFGIRENLFAEWVYACLVPLKVRTKQAGKADPKDLINLKKLKDNLAELPGLFGAGVLDAVQVADAANELKKNIGKLETKIAENSEQAFEQAELKTFRKLPLQDQRDYLYRLVESIHFTDDAAYVRFNPEVEVYGEEHRTLIFPMLKLRSEKAGPWQNALKPEEANGIYKWKTKSGKPAKGEGINCKHMAAYDESGKRIEQESVWPLALQGKGYVAQFIAWPNLTKGDWLTFQNPLQTPSGYKQCFRCSEVMPFSGFYPKSNGKEGAEGLTTFCKYCFAAEKAERKAKKK